MTKIVAEANGIDYDEVRLDEDPEALAYVRSLGYSSAPVVEAGEVHWSGFRPDKIKEYANASLGLQGR
jgi:glutaredoxin-like protein NrdH